MSQFELLVQWSEPQEGDEAVGPEGPTWARLTIKIDGQCVTRHHSSDQKAPDEDSVVGPMSGMAEWIVDHWRHLLWEVHPPFPKFSLGSGGKALLPGLRDVVLGWPALGNEFVDVSELGAWQQRHTFGLALSDLALPSILCMPDERAIGLVVDYPPSHPLDAPVRFTPPAAPSGWPSQLAWIPKDEFESVCGKFVDSTIGRAANQPESKQWAKWLSERWLSARNEASSPAIRRELQFGSMVASGWEELERTAGRRFAALTGLLRDCPSPRDESVLDSLVHAVTGVEEGAAGAWSGLLTSVPGGMKPYDQGYWLAARIRQQMKIEPAAPLGDLRDLFDELGVSVRRTTTQGMYRSAAIVTPSGGATILRSTDDERFEGVAPTRLALAAAFGRLIGDWRSKATGDDVFGAAQGPQSSLIAGQRANAFAVEFLLPFPALRAAETSPSSAKRTVSLARPRSGTYRTDSTTETPGAATRPGSLRTPNGGSGIGSSSAWSRSIERAQRSVVPWLHAVPGWSCGFGCPRGSRSKACTTRRCRGADRGASRPGCRVRSSRSARRCA